MSTSNHVIAVIGATGQLGAAIARRLVLAGTKVIVGSRDAGRAQEAAKALASETGKEVAADANAAAAAAADVVIVTVPYAAQRATLTEIAGVVSGKIVIDTTVPLMPPKVMRVQLPEEGSAAVAAQKILGPSVRLVSAFHNVPAHKLATDEKIACDVLVFGDERAARDVAIDVVSRCGLRGLHGGALCNSAAAEALTSVLIFINKTYSSDGAGIEITGTLNERPTA
ncbi:F420-dependent NADP reductase [Steroidobacter denitrificans]|uniref:F420-dependent NADP reductase n=1 Tax=Steroidobacter denitrificans TaxID=465721 RepID=A0A127FAN0_STEDE|nr:NADPH-dependent F420 reductase [Steroidobacter denitrificans]AMN47477.1 F420-dependent NADP reductase [Steroidobacter denitrificans]